MYMKAAVGVALAVVAGSRLVSPSSPEPNVTTETDLTAVARQAVSENVEEANGAIAALRARGPAGLQALLETQSDLVAKGPSYTAPQEAARAVVTTGVGGVLMPRRTLSPEWQRLSKAIDEVGQQRDNWASRLYWYTDLEQAKAAAKASGRPILALRLLGKLNEEYSCANSRLFRTALYPNAAISRYLRDHYVLYWKSVRPVPRVTIDFGDGRRIETTITGNSIHYVLDSEGRPLEALPGMTGPQPFLRWLTRSSELATTYLARSDLQERLQVLRDYHKTRLETVNREWAADMARVNAGITEIAESPVRIVNKSGSRTQVTTANASVRPAPATQRLTLSPAPRRVPDARDAANATFAKRAMELPVLRRLSPTQSASAPLVISNSTALPGSGLAGNEVASTDATWQRIAQLHMVDAALDGNSTRVIETKEPNALDAARLTFSKVAMDSPLLRVMLNFQRTVAEDTVYNEYVFHSRIHQWFVSGAGINDAEALNKKVYAELFLTPDSDPWLGLMPRGVFTGLPYDGVIMPESPSQNLQLARANTANDRR